MEQSVVPAGHWVGSVELVEVVPVISCSETEEIMEQLQRVKVPHVVNTHRFQIGDIVKWSFEALGDPQYGTLYMVVGFNSEKPDIIVTRVLDRPQEIREFNATQLTKL